MTLEEYLAEVRTKVYEDAVKPQQPDWANDQDVTRYSNEVGAIHRLMEIAERDAILSFQILNKQSKRKKV